MSWLWPAVAFLGAVAAVAVWRAFQSPDFYLRAATAVWRLVKPYVLKGLAPKDFTPEQRERLDRGQEPGSAGQNTRNNDGFHHK
jgi:hypothetical protein